jgi:hypothetical protein
MPGKKILLNLENFANDLVQFLMKPSSLAVIQSIIKQSSTTYRKPTQIPILGIISSYFRTRGEHFNELEKNVDTLIEQLINSEYVDKKLICTQLAQEIVLFIQEGNWKSTSANTTLMLNLINSVPDYKPLNTDNWEVASAVLNALKKEFQTAVGENVSRYLAKERAKAEELKRKEIKVENIELIEKDTLSKTDKSYVFDLNYDGSWKVSWLNDDKDFQIDVLDNQGFLQFLFNDVNLTHLVVSQLQFKTLLESFCKTKLTSDKSIHFVTKPDSYSLDFKTNENIALDYKNGQWQLLKFISHKKTEVIELDEKVQNKMQALTPTRMIVDNFELSYQFKIQLMQSLDNLLSKKAPLYFDGSAHKNSFVLTKKDDHWSCDWINITGKKRALEIPSQMNEMLGDVKDANEISPDLKRKLQTFLISVDTSMKLQASNRDNIANALLSKLKKQKGEDMVKALVQTNAIDSLDKEGLIHGQFVLTKLDTPQSWLLYQVTSERELRPVASKQWEHFKQTVLVDYDNFTPETLPQISLDKLQKQVLDVRQFILLNLTNDFEKFKQTKSVERMYVLTKHSDAWALYYFSSTDEQINVPLTNVKGLSDIIKRFDKSLLPSALNQSQQQQLTRVLSTHEPKLTITKVDEKKVSKLNNKLRKVFKIPVIPTSDINLIPKYRLVKGAYILTKEQGTWQLDEMLNRQDKKRLNTSEWDGFEQLFVGIESPEKVSVEIISNIRKRLEHYESHHTFMSAKLFAFTSFDDYEQKTKKAINPIVKDAYFITQKETALQLFYVNSVGSHREIDLSEQKALVKALDAINGTSLGSMSQERLTQLALHLPINPPSSKLNMNDYDALAKVLGKNNQSQVVKDEAVVKKINMSEHSALEKLFGKKQETLDKDTKPKPKKVQQAFFSDAQDKLSGFFAHRVKPETTDEKEKNPTNSY